MSMNPYPSDEILQMQVRLFSTFCQRHPQFTPVEMDDLFKKCRIWEFIREGYGGLHCEGDEAICQDILDIFHSNGVELGQPVISTDPENRSYCISIDDDVKPWTKKCCADILLAKTIQYLADEDNISLDEARSRLIHSWIYKVLYDYDSGLWGEGPVYLLWHYRQKVRGK